MNEFGGDEFDTQQANRRRNAFLRGLDVPDHWRDEGWVDVVEVLMARGAAHPVQVAGLVGQSVERCKGWMAEVKARWGGGGEGLKDQRREELYLKVMALGEAAVHSALGMSEQNGLKPRMMGMALQAYDKAGDLAGVKKTTIEVAKTVELKVAKPQEVLEGFGLGELADLGAAAAVGMRQLEAGDNEVVLEAVFEEVEGAEGDAEPQE